MRALNKIFAVILCSLLVINTSVSANAMTQIESNDEVQMYLVPVRSDEYPSDEVYVYKHQEKFYMSLDDIKDFTRCTLEQTDENIILTQGMRQLVIDKSSGNMSDSDWVEQGQIDCLEFNGEYLCEGIPMLMYLGAACTVNAAGELEVLMPTYTFWEAFMPDYLDYYFDIYEMYGGEIGVKVSLACDVIADIFDGISGRGIWATFDDHYKDALYETIYVDTMKYEFAQQREVDKNQKINDLLSSNSFKNGLELGENSIEFTYDALEHYAGFYLNTQIAKNEYLWKTCYEAGNLKKASELSSEINKQVYTQTAMQVELKTVKGATPLLEAGLFAFDTAMTSYALMQYEDDTRYLFSRTINDDIFKQLNYDDISWKPLSDEISETLKDNQSIVKNTAIDNIVKFVTKKVESEGLSYALKQFTSNENIYTTSIQLGLFLGSLINYDLNQAYSADMNALILNEVQYDVATLLIKLIEQEKNVYKFSNEESMERIKNMMNLYYRIIIAFSENMSKSLEEFGNRKGKEMIPWFSSTTEMSVANYTADYLYKLTNCTIVPIVDYNSLSDEVITQDWIELYEVKNNINEKLLNGIWLQDDSTDAIQFIFSTDGTVKYYATMSDESEYTAKYSLKHGKLTIHFVNLDMSGVTSLEYNLNYSENETLKILQLTPSVENEMINTSLLYGYEKNIPGTYVQLKAESVACSLGIPDNVEVENMQSEVYYWFAGDIYLTNIEFYKSGDMVACATVNALTGEHVRNIFIYSGYKDSNEVELKELAKTCGNILLWEYADYDGNGNQEAFFVIGKNEGYGIQTFFISSEGQITKMEELEWSLYDSDDGNIRYAGGKGFFWADMGAFGSGWISVLYSVKNDTPYILQLSGHLQGFYQEGAMFYTTENEFLPEGGHIYPTMELLYDSNTQEFVKGNKIEFDNEQ